MLKRPRFNSECVKGLLVLAKAHIANETRVVEDDALTPRYNTPALGAGPRDLQPIELERFGIWHGGKGCIAVYRVVEVIRQLRHALQLTEKFEAVERASFVTQSGAKRQRVGVIEPILRNALVSQSSINNPIARSLCLRHGGHGRRPTRAEGAKRNRKNTQGLLYCAHWLVSPMRATAAAALGQPT